MPAKREQPPILLERPNGDVNKGTLRETVKQALLDILSDKSAPAAAKASACRALLDHFGDSDSARGGAGKRSAEMTLEELDAEIAAASPMLPR